MTLLQQLLFGVGIGLFMAFAALLLVEDARYRPWRMLLGGGLGGLGGVFVGPWAALSGLLVGSVLAWSRWIGPVGRLVISILAAGSAGLGGSARRSRRHSRPRNRPKGWFGGGGRSGGGGASGRW
ncbi:hypothetical protein [Stenotrophomonas sp. MMGLT7]|uniref:hypothetical protein n=1 Tax=Stenotrophomonas sp. MMGLT7 TaxID=2901227 RepID=UPI001E4559AA|nr:hypothetical protein [Stenotrophomonas sp. MMGLT7]MCD7098202.1 hypothetical protein [Stenotrophomonas sp. MMGLT7]